MKYFQLGCLVQETHLLHDSLEEAEGMRYAKREHTDDEQQWRRPITRDSWNQASILREADNRAQLYEVVATEHIVSHHHILVGC